MKRKRGNFNEEPSKKYKGEIETILQNFSIVNFKEKDFEALKKEISKKIKLIQFFISEFPEEKEIRYGKDYNEISDSEYYSELLTVLPNFVSNNFWYCGVTFKKKYYFNFEILSNIFSFLPNFKEMQIRCVCRNFYRIYSVTNMRFQESITKNSFLTPYYKPCKSFKFNGNYYIDKKSQCNIILKNGESMMLRNYNFSFDKNEGLKSIKVITEKAVYYLSIKRNLIFFKKDKTNILYKAQLITSLRKNSSIDVLRKTKKKNFFKSKFDEIEESNFFSEYIEFKENKLLKKDYKFKPIKDEFQNLKRIKIKKEENLKKKFFFEEIEDNRIREHKIKDKELIKGYSKFKNSYLKLVSLIFGNLFLYNENQRNSSNFNFMNQISLSVDEDGYLIVGDFHTETEELKPYDHGIFGYQNYKKEDYEFLNTKCFSLISEESGKPFLRIFLNNKPKITVWENILLKSMIEENTKRFKKLSKYCFKSGSDLSFFNHTLLKQSLYFKKYKFLESLIDKEKLGVNLSIIPDYILINILIEKPSSYLIKKLFNSRPEIINYSKEEFITYCFKHFAYNTYVFALENFFDEYIGKDFFLKLFYEGASLYGYNVEKKLLKKKLFKY